MPRSRLSLLLSTLLCAACGDDARQPAPDAGASAVTAVALPQAQAGAMWANPDAYPTIPVHVEVTGGGPALAGVTVTVDGAATEAVRDGDGAWTARVAIAALAEGEHAVEATAGGVVARATLVTGRQGIAWTRFAVDHFAATPRLFRVDGRLRLVWADESEGPRTVWAQEVDGAGRPVAERVALVGGPGQPDVLQARAAASLQPDGTVRYAVLYQRAGGPYQNFLTVVAADGAVLLAPVALDPAERYGSYGGDVVATPDGFDVTWRTNDGHGGSDVRWLHVDGATLATTAPLIVAAPGQGDPHAGFDPFTNVSVARAGGASVVAFDRYEHDATLDLDVPRCQVATIATIAAGAATTAVVGASADYEWDDDCRVLPDGRGGALVVRSTKSLTSTADNIPDTLYATRLPLAADRGGGIAAVTAPEARDEPHLVPTAAAPVLAWSDARSYAAGTAGGEVEIYAAPLGADLVAGAPIRFAHSHLIAGTGDVRGAAVGTNAVLVWIDERHGGSVLDPRPEVYLDTAWQ